MSETDSPAGRGRPPLPQEIARKSRVVTFLTAQEKAALDTLAKEWDVSISAACHELIKEGLGKQSVT